MVAGAAVELASCRYVSDPESPFKIKGAQPFTEAKYYDVSLGGRREATRIVDIGGQEEEREIPSCRGALSSRKRTQIKDEFFSLSYINMKFPPQARLGMHSPTRAETCIIHPSAHLECVTPVWQKSSCTRCSLEYVGDYRVRLHPPRNDEDKVINENKAYWIWMFGSILVGVQLCNADGFPCDRDSPSDPHSHTNDSTYPDTHSTCTGVYPTRMCIYATCNHFAGCGTCAAHA